MSLKTPSTNPNLFFSEQYICVSCKHESIVFISKDYNLYNICDSDSYCKNCECIKSSICSGDLVFRTDWLEPDNDPWQMQCCYIEENSGFCDDCKPLYLGDFKDLMPVCPICESKMIYRI